MAIPIKNLGVVGLIRDLSAHDLPPNAWSNGQNVRFIDGRVERGEGHIPVYGTPGTSPNWLLPVPGLTDYYWIYMSLTKGFIVDSSGTHTEITRTAGGDYAGGLDINWNGGLINGIPVLNNGVDVPQMLTPPDPSSNLAPLTAWPASTTVRCLRPFKQFLFGMDWTESGVRYQHKVRWSNQAAAGGVPSSWNVADATVDAAQATLPDTGGFVLDSLPLRDSNIVYKENEVWSFQHVGGAKVFHPTRIVSSSGMLTRDCAAAFQGGEVLAHAVFGDDDLFVHDGNSARSIADKKLRKWLYAQISTSNYERCFVVANHPTEEIWFCFVPDGETLATLALPWHWRTNTFSPVRELPGIRFAAAGLINDTAVGLSWDTDVGSWDSDVRVWDDRTYGSPAPRLLLALQEPSLQYADQGNQFAGVNYTSYVERIGLPYARVDRNGNPESDLSVRKMMTELWPRLEAPTGTVVDIYVGAHETVDQGVSWKGPFPFVVGTHKKINPLVSGRYLAVKFQSTANVKWKLHEYAYEVASVGEY